MKGMTEIIIWDVLRGSAVTAILPDGKILWFDLGTGSLQSGEDFSLYKSMKSPLIDLLVLSHPHKNHIDDFKNIPAERVKKCLYNFSISREYHETFRDLNWEKSNMAEQVVKNFVLQYGSHCGAVCSCRFPWVAPLTVLGYWAGERISQNLNNYSVVTFLSQGNNVVCIPADIEEEGWEYLCQRYNPFFEELLRKTNILVASHHGSREGFYSKFPSLLRADIVVVQNGIRKEEDEAVFLYEGITSGHIVQKEIRNSSEWLYPPTFKKIKVLNARTNGTVKIFLSNGNFSVLATKGI